MIGLFKQGEEVEWGTVIRGNARRLRGRIYKVVAAGEKPVISGVDVRVEPDEDHARDHESYVVSVLDGQRFRYYWPRVSALAPAAARWPRDPVAAAVADEHALASVTRERDAMREVLRYRIGGAPLPELPPLTRTIANADGSFVVTYWRDRPPTLGVVEVAVTRMVQGIVPGIQRPEVEIVAVYFAADDRGDDEVDWLKRAGIRR